MYYMYNEAKEISASETCLLFLTLYLFCFSYCYVNGHWTIVNISIDLLFE